MKTISFLSILSLLFLATSCNKDKNDPVLKLDQDVEIDFGQTAPFNEGNFSVQFEELLEDSRCPEGPVACFWEGRVRVQINISDREDSYSYELITKNSINGDSLVTVEYGQYIIELKEVNPYPVFQEPVDIDDYSIVLEVTEM